MLKIRDIVGVQHQQANQQEHDMSDFTNAVRQHAIAHYEQDGWDYIVECYDDAQIADIIKTARTEKGAIRMMRAHIKPRADYRADIQAEAF